MKAKQIFTPGKFPKHTFVDEHLVEKERLLKFTLSSGGQLISISGPSKSGKTVFVEKVIGKDNLIQVSGSSIRHENDLWSFVLGAVGTPIPYSISEIKTAGGGIGSELSSGLNLGVFQVQAKISGSGEEGRERSITSTYTNNLLDLVAKEFAESEFVIFIDDFHYIEKQVQSRVANQMKELIRRDVKIICASVPFHADDVLRANTDLQGRILSIDFEYWQDNILRNIIHKGSQILNVKFPENFINRISLESSGSPQLMQSLCLAACFVLRIEEAAMDYTELIVTDKQIKDICSQVALTTDFSSIYEQMVDGARIRGSERKSFFTSGGNLFDVYGVVLNALALDPPRLTIRYKELSERVQAFCTEEAPSGSSITSTCRQIAKIAKMNYPLEIIAWDSEVDVLEIRDPYFLFYIRWGEK